MTSRRWARWSSSTSGRGAFASTPTSSTPTITSSAAGAARCATSRSTSPVSGCPRATGAGSRCRGSRSTSGGCATSAPRRSRPPPERSPARSTNTRRSTMPKLKDTTTHDNLKTAFAGESQANRRYLYFAQKADVEGYPDIAALFRSVAEGETGHAFGHFDFLAEVGDPVTGVDVGPTTDNLKSAIEGETYEYTEMYPGFARTARDEGFDEIGEWLETLARAEKSHAGRSTQGLEQDDAVAHARRHQRPPRIRTRTRRVPTSHRRDQEAPPRPARRPPDDHVREHRHDAVPDPGDGAR